MNPMEKSRIHWEPTIVCHGSAQHKNGMMTTVTTHINSSVKLNVIIFVLLPNGGLAKTGFRQNNVGGLLKSVCAYYLRLACILSPLH